ncbi:MAG: alcohol dehydrogenase catalytic domain-containing protein [Oscillospiraceae bacterium]|jgi:L-iditol 2-dehydrogenase|nr:alcohol dehydrogenase catalytic domain-containing protein [Oscillospiraceae bacterium]
MEPNKVEMVTDLPMPVLGDYQCLVKVKACGICSSTDLKIVHHQHPESDFMKFTYPTILGHEAVGEIVELGPKVKYLKVGDRVVSPLPSIPRGGKYTSSYGQMSEYCTAMDIKAMKEDNPTPEPGPGMFFAMGDEIDFLTKVFPKEIDFVDAAMMLTFKENYSALINFGVKEGMDILIYGDGSICLGLTLQLKAYKVNSVTVIGHHDDRLEKIASLSHPDLTINSHKQDPAEVLKDKKFDIVIDAAGSTEIIYAGARFLKPCGKVCVYGVLAEGKSTIDLYKLPNNVGVHIMSYPYREHRTQDVIVKQMLDGTIDAKVFYDAVMPVEQCAEAISKLEKREVFKVILTWD